LEFARELVAYLTPRQAAVLYWVVFLAAAYMAWGIFFVAIPRAEHSRNAEICKRNLHAIQLAVERYAVDSPHADYPYDVCDVIRAGYIDAFPINPFSGEPMQPYPPGSEPPLGDFIYEPKGIAGRYIDNYKLTVVY